MVFSMLGRCGGYIKTATDIRCFRQKRVLHAIGNLDWRTPVRDLHLAFKIPCVYDYITKLRRRQAEVILNHENPNVRAIGQGEPRHRKYKRLKLGDGQAYNRSSV
jgi:hypothetical protein